MCVIVCRQLGLLESESINVCLGTNAHKLICLVYVLFVRMYVQIINLGTMDNFLFIVERCVSGKEKLNFNGLDYPVHQAGFGAGNASD